MLNQKIFNIWRIRHRKKMTIQHDGKLEGLRVKRRIFKVSGPFSIFEGRCQKKRKVDKTCKYI